MMAKHHQYSSIKILQPPWEKRQHSKLMIISAVMINSNNRLNDQRQAIRSHEKFIGVEDNTTDCNGITVIPQHSKST